LQISIGEQASVANFQPTDFQNDQKDLVVCGLRTKGKFGGYHPLQLTWLGPAEQLDQDHGVAECHHQHRYQVHHYRHLQQSRQQNWDQVHHYRHLQQ
jgi:hypothetical protein